MYNDFYNKLKYLIVTQIICIISAVIAELHQRVVIRYNILFTNKILFVVGIIFVLLIYTILIIVFLNKSYLEIIVVPIFFMIYLNVVSYLVARIIPLNIQPKDYGIGILGIVIVTSDFISIILANIFRFIIKIFKLISKYKCNNQ